MLFGVMRARPSHHAFAILLPAKHGMTIVGQAVSSLFC